MSVRLRVVSIAALIVIVVAFSVFAVKLSERGRTADERAQQAAQAAQQAAQGRVLLCEAQNRSNDALRRVLLLAQSLAKESPDATPSQREQAREFYKQALGLIHPLDCKAIS